MDVDGRVTQEQLPGNEVTKQSFDFKGIASLLRQLANSLEMTNTANIMFLEWIDR